MSGHGNLEEIEEADGFSFGGLFRRYRTPLLAAASLVVFCLVGYAIMQLTNEVRYDDVVLALADTKISSILLALFFTGLSFFALVFYDLNAIEYIGKKLPFPHVALTAFSAYAVGNTAGFGALCRRRDPLPRLYAPRALAGGNQAHHRLRHAVLRPRACGRRAIALIVIADEIGPLVGISPFLLRLIAGSIVAILGAVMIIGRDGSVLDLGPVAIRLPDSRTWSRQFLVTAFDIAASASVLYVLLPDTAIGWPVFLAVYAIAVGLGVLSHVPAGLGVFETVIIASLGNAVNIDAVLGSLVLYRLVYHVLPLLIAVLAVSAAELRRFVDHPAASSVRRIGGG